MLHEYHSERGLIQDKERPLGFLDQQRIPREPPPFYDPQ
jgi:hypothetical protein